MSNYIRYPLTLEHANRVEELLLPENKRKLERLVSYLEAEGSVFLTLRVQPGRAYCYRLSLSINIANMSLDTIKGFQEFTKCGTIRTQKRQKVIYYWEVSSQEEIINVLLPVLRECEIGTEKLSHDLPLFTRCTQLINSNEHYTVDLLLEVLALRNKFIARTVKKINDREKFLQIIEALREKQKTSKDRSLNIPHAIDLLEKAVELLRTRDSIIWEGW